MTSNVDVFRLLHVLTVQFLKIQAARFGPPERGRRDVAAHPHLPLGVLVEKPRDEIMEEEGVVRREGLPRSSPDHCRTHEGLPSIRSVAIHERVDHEEGRPLIVVLVAIVELLI